MKNILALAVMAIVLTALPSKTIAAPNEPTPYIGVYYLKSNFTGADTQGMHDEYGPGIRGGLESAKRIFAYEVSYFETKWESGPTEQSLSGLTFDVKLSLPISDLLTPYGFAGVGNYVLHTSDTVIYRGGDYYFGYKFNGFQLGGGFEIHLSKYFTLNVGYTKRRILFDQGTSDANALHAQAITYDVGLNLHVP